MLQRRRLRQVMTHEAVSIAAIVLGVVGALIGTVGVLVSLIVLAWRWL
jgi:hypothetical protein